MNRLDLFWGCFCGVAEVLLAFHPEIASYQSRAA